MNYKTLLPVLTEEQIKRDCPQAFASAPSNHVSDKYVFVNTESVIKDMAELGWYPVAAKQRRARKGVKSRFSTHMVIFQNPDVQIKSEEDALAPSILLLNSHDGTSTFQFRMGIYRMVCSNGMVIPEEEYTAFRIRHIGYTFNALREAMTKCVERISEKVQLINKMISTELSEEQQMEIALKALYIRTGLGATPVEAPVYSEDTLQEVLKSTRKEDEGNNLWVVFNRVQEAVTRGGFRVQIEGKKARPLNKIKSFEKDLRVNEELFEMALEVLN